MVVFTSHSVLLHVLLALKQVFSYDSEPKARPEESAQISKANLGGQTRHTYRVLVTRMPKCWVNLFAGGQSFGDNSLVPRRVFGCH